MGRARPGGKRFTAEFLDADRMQKRMRRRSRILMRRLARSMTRSEHLNRVIKTSLLKVVMTQKVR